MQPVLSTAPFAAALLLAALAATPGMAQDAPFRAQGNEPSWSLQKSADTITFSGMGGEAIMSPIPAEKRDGNAAVFEGTAGGAPFVVRIADEVCTDQMSGMPFPNAVTVTLGTLGFKGCGGSSESLLVGDWKITAIDGKPVVAKSEPSIAFEAGGKLSGNGSCNRYFGNFTLTGEGLTIGQVGSTMMACEEPLMKQEAEIQAIFKAVTGFAIAADGALTLKAGDRSITATR